MYVQRVVLVIKKIFFSFSPKFFSNELLLYFMFFFFSIFFFSLIINSDLKKLLIIFHFFPSFLIKRVRVCIFIKRPPPPQRQTSSFLQFVQDGEHPECFLPLSFLLFLNLNLSFPLLSISSDYQFTLKSHHQRGRYFITIFQREFCKL